MLIFVNKLGSVLDNFDVFVKTQNNEILKNLQSKYLVKLTHVNKNNSSVNYELNLIIERKKSAEIKINNIAFYSNYSVYHSFQKIIISVNSISIFFTTEEIKFYLIDKFCIQKVIGDWLVTCNVTKQFME